jgi:tetratricopeptide (TPR) repeat protein
LACGINLVRAGFVDEGLEVINEISRQDPRNLDAINALARIYEELNRLSEANEYREKMIILDKWNAVNYLQLGKNFKALGDSERSQQMLEILNSFASENPIIDQARIELGF